MRVLLGVEVDLIGSQNFPTEGDSGNQAGATMQKAAECRLVGCSSGTSMSGTSFASVPPLSFLPEPRYRRTDELLATAVHVKIAQQFSDASD